MTTDIHALSGAFSVDALDESERDKFERHLDTCPTCRDEVDELREAAMMLTMLTAVTPPVRMRAAVLDAVTTVRPLPPATPATPVIPVASARRPENRRRWWATGAALAAAVLAAVLVIGPFSSPTPTRPSAISKVIHADDVRTIDQRLADGQQITWYVSKSQDRVAVVAHDLASPPAGKVYQLWLQDDAGTMVPAGFLSTGGVKESVLHGSLGAATAAAFTVEPTGGSKSPTSNPVTLVEFAS